MLEKQIEKKIGEYAKSKQCLYMKWTSPGYCGVPDRIVIAPSGQVFFIELKALGKKLSPLQERFHGKLHERGCYVYRVDNVDDGKKIIDLFV